jgi:predicted RNA-binding Zn-ribbon protein involved in translation (DUF1610 family)
MNNETENNPSCFSPGCPVCGNPLIFRLAKSKRTGKPFIMLACKLDGRHFRGFICDRTYIGQVVDQLESNK